MVRTLLLTIGLTAGLTGPVWAVGAERPGVERYGNALMRIRYGSEGSQRYLQIWIHKASNDGRCAEGWARFTATGGHILAPVSAITCTYRKSGWSPKYLQPAAGPGWSITGYESATCTSAGKHRMCSRPWPEAVGNKATTYWIK
jgi:hypothetical protein